MSNYDVDAECARLSEYQERCGWPRTDQTTDNYMLNFAVGLLQSRRPKSNDLRWLATFKRKHHVFDLQAVVFFDAPDDGEISTDETMSIYSLLRANRNVSVSFRNLDQAVAWLKGVHPPAEHGCDGAQS